MASALLKKVTAYTSSTASFLKMTLLPPRFRAHTPTTKSPFRLFRVPKSDTLLTRTDRFIMDPLRTRKYHLQDKMPFSYKTPSNLKWALNNIEKWRTTQSPFLILNSTNFSNTHLEDALVHGLDYDRWFIKETARSFLITRKLDGLKENLSIWLEKESESYEHAKVVKIEKGSFYTDEGKRDMPHVIEGNESGVQKIFHVFIKPIVIPQEPWTICVRGDDILYVFGSPSDFMSKSNPSVNLMIKIEGNTWFETEGRKYTVAIGLAGEIFETNFIKMKISKKKKELNLIIPKVGFQRVPNLKVVVVKDLYIPKG